MTMSPPNVRPANPPPRPTSSYALGDTIEVDSVQGEIVAFEPVVVVVKYPAIQSCLLSYRPTEAHHTNSLGWRMSRRLSWNSSCGSAGWHRRSGARILANQG